MNAHLLTLLVGTGFFVSVSIIFWGVMALIMRAMDARNHSCWDALTWCEHCMDSKQQVWSQHMKEMQR